MYKGLYTHARAHTHTHTYIYIKRNIRSLIQLGEAAAFPVTKYN